jgi:uncharacterized protein
MADLYVARLADDLLTDLVREFAAVMVVGPRASGKTTSAQRVCRSIVHLDRDVEAAPVRVDPDVVLAEFDRPILLDEWQMVPEVLASVKRAVDVDGSPGQFVLTGSVRAELLPSSWAATGRVVGLTQWGLTERELRGAHHQRPLLDVVFDGDLTALNSPAAPLTVRDYLDCAVRGTFPGVALRSSERGRTVWWDSYLDRLINRDAMLAEQQRDPVKLRRYLAALAANTAGIIEHKALYDAAGITRVTAERYDTLLEMLFVLERLPAWHSNRLNRLTRSDKRYLTDAAIATSLLGADTRSLLRNGDLLGRIMDTFLLSQLRPELEVSAHRPRLHHLRLDSNRREVDIIAEARDGRVVGIECKATAAPSIADAVHLIWLRDQLGDQFAGGVVFHTGPRVVQLGDRIAALPIASLWDRG